MSLSKYAGFILLFSLCSYILHAQDTTSIVDLSEIVKTANRFPELKKNVAQQVEVITSAKLREFNAQNTGDALQLSGQVFIQKSQQGGSSPILRGFEASRVLLVVDGVRMNNAIFRAGHLQNVIRVDNNMLDRLEVLFGPSSTVYGSDALGGVVHMRTRDPQFSDSARFRVSGNTLARYSSANNEFTGHAALNLGGRKFASLTAFTWSRFGDMRMGENGSRITDSIYRRNWRTERFNGRDSMIANPDPLRQPGSGYTQYDIMQKFIFNTGKKFSHLINLQFSNTGNVPRTDRLSELRTRRTPASADTLSNAEWYYGPETRLLAAYELRYKDPGGLIDEMNIGINYQLVKESRNTRSFGSLFRTERSEQLHIPAFYAQFKKEFSRRHDLYFGLEGQFNDLKSSALARDVDADTTRPASTRYPAGKNKFNSLAIYASHNWYIGKWGIFSQGFRYNYVGLRSDIDSNTFYRFKAGAVKQNHHAVSGSVGLVANLPKGFRIAAMGSSGFRAPNIDDLSKIFDSRRGIVVVPNPSLQPEYTINADLTLEYKFQNIFRISTTAFYTEMFNAIVTDRFNLNGSDSVLYDGVLSQVLANQNKQRAFVSGVSASVLIRPVKWFTIEGSVNYTYGRIRTDSTAYPLDHIAPLFGRVGFNAAHKSFKAQVFVLFSGDKKKADMNLVGEDNFQYGTPDGYPAWFTLNIRLSQMIVKNHVWIDLGADNILDHQYRTFSSGFTSAGRNLFAAVRASF